MLVLNKLTVPALQPIARIQLAPGQTIPIVCFNANVYMDGVVREVNVKVLGKGLELLSENGARFKTNQLLFADDTALVANSEEKLCRLVGESSS